MKVVTWVSRRPVAARMKTTRMGRWAVARHRQRSAPERALWFYREAPLRPDVVLYQAADGKGLFGNPRSIFDHLVADPAYRHLQHVWVVDSLDVVQDDLRRELGGGPRVSFVQYRTAAYYRALSTAGYLINDTTFPAMWGKRPGQVYVNTWHGMPLKKMGYDLPGGAMATRNILRNLVAADYLLSTGPAMTDLLYRGAFRLEGIYQGTIIEEGYPCVDRQLSVRPAMVEQQLLEHGIDVRGREVILFAPTWRGSTQEGASDQAHDLVEIVREVEGRLDPDTQVLLVRAHPFVHDKVQDAIELDGRLVPKSVITSDLLAMAGHLVTDYSSIFFDFLPMRRPISFLIPDLEEFDADRGLYFQPQEWPGPVYRTAAALGDALACDAHELAAFAQRRERWRERYAPQDDGEAARRVVEVVFGRRTEDCRLVHGLRTDRTTVLIHAGGLSGNGITSSLLSLLSLLDHDRYDVSVFYPTSRAPAFQETLERIDPRVRHFPRVGAFLARPNVMALGPLYQIEGPQACGEDAALYEAAMGEEWVRCFGDLRFDHVIDFSGYATFWVALLLQGAYGRASIWLHSDLQAELEASWAGLRPNGRYLQGVCRLLDRFDHIVSATEELNDVSRRRLAAYAPADRFTWVTNTLDVDALWARARGGATPTDPEPVPVARRRFVAEADSDVVRDIEDLATRHGWSQVSTAVARLRPLHAFLPVDPETTTFVTMGRLSAEKNHARLLRAFATVHRRHPNVQLLVIGRGELGRELRSMASDLGVHDNVRFTGHLSNPMPVLRECDCFVMSSLYEGQGLVILEALVLGLPVISTRFDAVSSVLPPGQGLVVDQDDEALAEGMVAFLDGQVPHLAFDETAYNRKALAEFRRVIPGRSR